MPAYICDVTANGEETTVDWDGPGTFYYKKDQTKALVLTDIDDPERLPAFSVAADIEALIDSGEYDLPTDAFGVLSALVWAAPPPPEPETETLP